MCKTQILKQKTIHKNTQQSSSSGDSSRVIGSGRNNHLLWPSCFELLGAAWHCLVLLDVVWKVV
jgi:hypothetical protein